MVSDMILEQLRHKGEGSDLDYKAGRYSFEGASDEDKSEMLKDILAMANAHRDGTAYILMGFKENRPHPAELVGLPPDGTIDDSRLQQFVNGKLDSTLIFHYEERLFDDKHVAIISIPKQPRPFYAKRDYGKVAKNAVYVRRGSSTAIASPKEIAMMGEANATIGDVQVDLLFQTAENEPLPDAFEREFLNFPEDLPDYEASRNNPAYIPIGRVNSDYWRDGADYFSAQKRAIEVRLSLVSQSSFSLGDAHMEVTCRCPDDESVSMRRADDMPGEPDSQDFAHLASMRTMIEQANERVSVDTRGNEPTAHITLGTVRPGQTVLAEEDLVILPSGPGLYVLHVRILANEISTPLLFEHPFEVTGEVTDVDETQLKELMLSLIE